jgi:hypothetical protein
MTGKVFRLGYFRDELVVRRKWIDELGYGDLVALCQLLPSPASSQVGFSLGMLRDNCLLDGLAAWFAFTKDRTRIEGDQEVMRRARFDPKARDIDCAVKIT